METSTAAEAQRLGLIHDLPPYNIGGHPLTTCTRCSAVYYDVPGQRMHGPMFCVGSA